MPGTKWPERATYHLPQSGVCCQRPTVEFDGAMNNRSFLCIKIYVSVL
jgi:hypothetical protein